jgi:phospholipid-transporting ATPase
LNKKNQGADSVIVPRVSMHSKDYRDYTDKTVEHLEHFAKEGFRTLIFAYKLIPKQEYDEWSQIYHQAATSLQNRDKNLDEAAELIEKNLIVLGATGIEDKLQLVSFFLNCLNLRAKRFKSKSDF